VDGLADWYGKMLDRRESRCARRCGHKLPSQEGPFALIVTLLYSTIFTRVGDVPRQTRLDGDTDTATIIIILIVIIIYDRFFSNGVVYRLPGAMRATTNQPLTLEDSTA